ncbi:MAG: MFS transporter [Clostridia bacterium]|nr:MFS transporter [Clostridia bacterium]
MSIIQSKKQVNSIAILFMTVYMVSYITRINYGAIISEMESSAKIAKDLLSMALTGSFITYGAGQIISGLCGDRFSPKKLVAYGLVATVLMNLLIPICQNPYQMLAVWCVNGFAQSFMWPPIVRLMTALLSEEDYKKTSVIVSYGSSFGTIAVYLIAPIIISLLNWKWVFRISAIFGIIMIAIWLKLAPEVESEKKVAAHQSGNNAAKAMFSPLMVCVMLSIILQGMLRDGVTTWMPSYIAETYNFSNVISILTGVVLPIFSIICFKITSKLYRETFTNPMTCAGVIFGVGAISSVALLIFTGKSAAFSVLFSAMLTGCMHGVNLILICMIPPFFKKYGSTATVSGVLNSCTYIGSAISTYGIAVISKNFGWSFTLLIWLLIAASGTALCFISANPWKKKHM